MINFSNIKDIPFPDIKVDQFSNYFKYIGCEFDIKSMEFNNLEVKFQIWNLSPKFSSIIDFYLIGSMGAIILFDHNNIDSFMKTMAFVDKLWSINGRDTIPITLIGLNPSISSDKSFDPADQIQEVIEQFTQPHSSGIRLRYIPCPDDFELLFDKLLFYFVDNNIIRNQMILKENSYNKTNLLDKLKNNQMSLKLLQNREDLHGISCVMDRIKSDLDSIKGWIQCKNCTMFICPSCLSYIISDNYYYCPGSIYGQKHELNPVSIT
jgi:hypothetical protein